MALDDEDKLELLNQRVRGWANAALSNWAALGDWVSILADPVIPEGRRGEARDLVRGMCRGPVLSRRASLEGYRQRFLKPADLKRRDQYGACINDVLHTFDIAQGLALAFPTTESVWDAENLDRLLHGQAIGEEDRLLLAEHGLAAVDDTGLPRRLHTPGTANPLADQPEHRPSRKDLTGPCPTSDTEDEEEPTTGQERQEEAVRDARTTTVQELLATLRNDPAILDDLLSLVEPAGT